MPEPLRNEDDSRRPLPTAGDDELEAILSEARASRPSRPARDPNVPRAAARATGAVPMGELPQGSPGSGVRFLGPRTEIQDPGTHRIEAFRLTSRHALAIALGVTVTCMWALLPEGMQWGRPQWLNPVYAEASSYWALMLTAERIDRFATEHGRRPASLAELSGNLPDLVTYEAVGDDDYRLRAPGQYSVIAVDSRTPRAGILRSSVNVLRAAPTGSP